MFLKNPSSFVRPWRRLRIKIQATRLIKVSQRRFKFLCLFLKSGIFILWTVKRVQGKFGRELTTLNRSRSIRWCQLVAENRRCRRQTAWVARGR